MTNNTPAPADLVEAAAKIASISVDEMRIHEEARERTTNDATQSGYDFHLIRVAAEHGARLAAHRCAAAITFDRDGACPICHMNEGCSHTVTERQRAAAITPQLDQRDAEIERLYQSAKANNTLARMNADQRDNLRAKNVNLLAEIERLREALKALRKDIDDLVSNSQGVAGLHLNGEIADWDSLLSGGSFGAWLGSVELADEALAKSEGKP
jgi:uncharacterized Zn finger protein (UPF0148 family)